MAMDTVRLRALVTSGSSIRNIATELDVAYSTVRYWLHRLDLETEHAARRRLSKEARDAGLRRIRLRCQKHGPTTFFERPDGGFRCLKCNCLAVSERRRRVKLQLVQEAGGCCRLCGFDEHPAALQFHHLDPATKQFNLGERGLTRSINRMREEARKCVLLCANCHALVEAGVRTVPC